MHPRARMDHEVVTLGIVLELQIKMTTLGINIRAEQHIAELHFTCFYFYCEATRKR